MTEWIDPLVLFTIMLAAATIYYAWMTKKLASETKLSRETQQKQYSLEMKPSLKICTRWHGVTLLPSIINIGRTPATDVDLLITVAFKDGTEKKTLQPLKIKYNLLMPGMSIPFYVPSFSYDEIKEKYQSLSFTGTCCDVDGNKHTIDDIIIFDLPAKDATPAEEMWLILPSDEPLIQIKNQIKTTGDDIARKLSELSKEVKILGPVVDGYCISCKKHYHIDTRESHKCPECGDDLALR